MEGDIISLLQAEGPRDTVDPDRVASEAMSVRNSKFPGTSDEQRISSGSADGIVQGGRTDAISETRSVFSRSIASSTTSLLPHDLVGGYHDAGFAKFNTSRSTETEPRRAGTPPRPHSTSQPLAGLQAATAAQMNMAESLPSPRTLPSSASVALPTTSHRFTKSKGSPPSPSGRIPGSTTPLVPSRKHLMEEVRKQALRIVELERRLAGARSRAKKAQNMGRRTIPRASMGSGMVDSSIVLVRTPARVRQKMEEMKEQVAKVSAACAAEVKVHARRAERLQIRCNRI